jgi:hypothetical protein
MWRLSSGVLVLVIVIFLGSEFTLRPARIYPTAKAAWHKIMSRKTFRPLTYCICITEALLAWLYLLSIC